MRTRTNDYARTLQGKKDSALAIEMDSELRDHGIKATSFFHREEHKAGIKFMRHVDFNTKVAAMEVFTKVHDDFKLEDIVHTSIGHTYIYFKAIV
jgi:hypothetical protein